MNKENQDNLKSVTPLLDFFGRMKQRFTIRRCVILCILLALFIFFYNPTKIDVMFGAMPNNAIAAVYVNSLSKEWSGAMKNNILMGSASVIAKEDLSDLRTNEGIKWTLRLLTGKDSVVAAVDTNGDQQFDFGDGDYLAGTTSIGFRRRIMELLWHIKYVPGLGKLSTDGGIRYLDFSKHKVGPSPRNPVLALDVVDGILCVAFTANPEDLHDITKRVNTTQTTSDIFKATDEPWKLRSSNALPKNFMIWCRDFYGVCGISSLTEKSLEIRLLNANKEVHKFFENVGDFEELMLSPENISVQNVSVDNAVFFSVFNNRLLTAIEALTNSEKHPKKTIFKDNYIGSFSLLADQYSIDIMGKKIPSIHFSTTQTDFHIDSDILLLEPVADILKSSKRNSISASNWQKKELPPKAKNPFDFASAAIKFGAYAEQTDLLYKQGIASLNSVKSDMLLPETALSGVYTLGNMVEFFAEECGTSYFIGYCDLKKLSTSINLLQENLKLVTMFTNKIKKEQIQDFTTIALVVDKLAEAETLSVGVSRIEDKKLKHLLRTNQVYCLSINLK